MSIYSTRFRRLTLGLLLCLGVPGTLWGQVTVPVSHEYARLGQSPLMQGSGASNTSTAVGPDALFLNPAGLVLEETWKVYVIAQHGSSFNYSDFRFNQFNTFMGNSPGAQLFLNGQGGEGNSQRDFHSLVYHNGSGFALALFSGRGQHSIGFMDPFAAGTLNKSLISGKDDWSGGQITYSWASGFRTFMFGLSVKGVTWNGFERYDTAATLGASGYTFSGQTYRLSKTLFDAGIQLRLPVGFFKPTFGLAALNQTPNTGGTVTKNLPERTGLSPEINAGFSLGPMDITDQTRLTLTAENRDIGLQSPQSKYVVRDNWGAKLEMFPIGNDLHGLTLATGAYQGRPSVGAKVRLSTVLSLEYSQYTEHLVVESPSNPVNVQPDKREFMRVVIEF
ncbi:MAG: hypothetical protein OEV94_00970 [Deltaproteobacteria bacterium]|nr:hypothetical protein [Deltaproteobacteria bacterium]